MGTPESQFHQQHKEDMDEWQVVVQGPGGYLLDRGIRSLLGCFGTLLPRVELCLGGAAEISDMQRLEACARGGIMQSFASAVIDAGLSHKG